MDGFRALLHALPSELYDKIFDLTFTKCENSHAIDKTYKPPNSLLVSRSTRDQFAKSYCGDRSIFYISQFTLSDFIDSLTIEHRMLFSEIRLIDAELDLHSAKLVAGCSSDLLEGLLRWGTLLKNIESAALHEDVVKIPIIYPDETRKWVRYWHLIMGDHQF